MRKAVTSLALGTALLSLALTGCNGEAAESTSASGSAGSSSSPSGSAGSGANASASTGGGADAPPSPARPSARASSGSTAAAATPGPAGRASGPAARTWAGSKRFMQIRSGTDRNGVVRLKVRPAKKEHLGESFETVDLGGLYTDVVLAPNARILTLDGESGTGEAFVSDLPRRSANQRKEGFDLTFDRRGQVTQVEWLYKP